MASCCPDRLECEWETSLYQTHRSSIEAEWCTGLEPLLVSPVRPDDLKRQAGDV